jgi:hypothetical protein
VSGLIRSPKNTLPGMYAAVFEAGWSSAALMQRHRAVMAREHRGRGRDVIGVDWTLVPHDRGPHIYGVKKASDDVARRTRLFQTVLTAVVAHRVRRLGNAV